MSNMLFNAPDSAEYRPEIDGLRAIAILSVMFIHLGVLGIAMWVVGVDIFFVISGYLITRIMYEEVSERGSFNFSSFYIRRVRRPFPALVFTPILSFTADGTDTVINKLSNQILSTVGIEN